MNRPNIVALLWEIIAGAAKYGDLSSLEVWKAVWWELRDAYEVWRDW